MNVEVEHDGQRLPRPRRLDRQRRSQRLAFLNAINRVAVTTGAAVTSAAQRVKLVGSRQ